MSECPLQCSLNWRRQRRRSSTARSRFPAWGINAMERATLTLGELSRIEPKPGEFFVLHTEENLEMRALETVTQYWKDKVGDVPLFIIGPGARLSVCKPETKEDHF